jgi:hypothetical protein
MKTSDFYLTFVLDKEIELDQNEIQCLSIKKIAVELSESTEDTYLTSTLIW